MKQTFTRRVRTTERVSLEISGKQLIDLLRYYNTDIPVNATVQFRVPSGGDWSGMDVDVDKDSPVRVVYEQHTDKTNEHEEEHRTPYEQRKLEEQRVRQADNDDAKIDNICITLGLDHETSDIPTIRTTVLELLDSVEKKVIWERRKP